ncbi:MAG TPA: hypothetical protein VFN88_05060 [Caulobacteraceae bacterium]|nr:hypothetical protein [Caulobacteraceae bacterium]
MAKAPPIPKEQRSFGGRRPDLADQSLAHDDRDANLAERGRQGNIRQNLTNQHKVQDR